MFLRTAEYTSPLKMPTQQFDEAFALLERSFNDASFLKAYKSLPHGNNMPEATRLKMPRARTSTTATDEDDDDDTISEVSMHEGYGDKMTPPLSLVRRASALPPTPPSQSRDSQSDTVRPQLIPLPPSKSGVSTPVLQRSPPTPDLTPPNTRERNLQPPRPSPMQCPSSAADSFVTAREALSRSSAQTSQTSLPFETPAERTWIDSARLMQFGGFDPGYDDDEEEDGTVTPTRETVGESRPLPLIVNEEQDVVDRQDDDATEQESDANFLRNVTMRKKRPRKAESPVKHEQSSETSGKCTTLANELEESAPPHRKKSSHSLRRAVVTSDRAEDGEWPAAVNDMLYKHMRDEKSKRLSDMSVTSTIVEAVVYLNPPPKSQTLRHAGRNLALRGDGSSNRTCSDSIATSHNHLRHRRLPLPGRADMVKDGLDSTRTLRAASNPETRTQRPQQIPVIVIPERRASHPPSQCLFTPHLRRHEKLHLLTDQQHRLHHSKPNTTLLQAENSSGSARPSLDEQLEATGPELSIPTLESPVRLQPSRLRHVSAPLQLERPTSKLVQLSPVRSNGLDNRPSKIDLPPSQGWHRSMPDSDLLSPESEHPSSLRRPSIDQGESPSLSRTLQFGSNHGLYDYSMQLSPRKSDHANARHLHSAATPASVAVSTFSDRTDLMEVNEAKAVNLYPHQNRSLILVQHLSRSSDASRTVQDHSPLDELSTPSESDDYPDETRSLRPVFTAVVEPSTPIAQLFNLDSVDSPLRNPRAAPQPPVIQFIPPTPSASMEETRPERSPSPPKPIRRPSLVQRARRYSESILQPFRSTSVSRRHSHERPSSSADRDTTLHPFWRPRGFWDEFDSDSDSFSDDDDEALPPGGDTSDIGHDDEVETQQRKQWSPRKMSVRMPGFRGTGGFLLGNTLGIDRHGTNVRRPYVALPFSRNTASSADSGSALRKKKSEELIRTLNAYSSSDSLRRRNVNGGVAKRYRAHRIPGLGLQVQILGIKGVKEKMRAVRLRREEVAREKRRQVIRDSIGEKIFHDDGLI